MPPPAPMLAAETVSRLRGILPTGMDTAGLRELGPEVLARAVFTARGTNAIFVSRLKEIIDMVAAGDMGEGQAETAIWEVLKALGYTPEGGYPDSMPGEVPPAVRGSLQDLSSFRRIRLIVRTQLDLMTGAGQQMRGQEALSLTDYPAWELVRIEQREIPRDWSARWLIAGGRTPNIERPTSNAEGRVRMIALKGDPVWGELGAYENFDDALGVDHPPFAFNSGMGWVEVSGAEVARLGITGPSGESPEQWLASRPETLRGTMPLPATRLSMKDVDPQIIREFQESTGATETAGGMFDFSAILAAELAAAGADGKGGAK